MKSNRILASIGGFLLSFGILSAILYFFDMNLVLIAWIDIWGVTVGWVIRVVMIVIGGVMLLVDRLVFGRNS